MGTNRLIEFIQDELASEQPTTTLKKTLKVLQPGIDRLVFDAKESATQAERIESVCRRFASQISDAAVVVLLCLRKEDVGRIAQDNKEKIAKYAKTLKGRRKRHGLNGLGEAYGNRTKTRHSTACRP